MNTQTPKRVFSGVQPTGHLHLGNYLGAIKHWVELQNGYGAQEGSAAQNYGPQENYECIYCLVDLHAITVPQDPENLRLSIYEAAACLLAAGINPLKSILFCQSVVPQHAELAWLFNCVARMGWLNRMTQFKDKAHDDKDQATIGLYAYPILMAADILAYKAQLVPVGEDQKQHLELTRDIALAFNHAVGTEFFAPPEPLIHKTAARIMSLRDGQVKMSKSDASDAARLNLIDTDDEIMHKIKRAKTDADALPSEMEGLKDRHEARNLIGIYAALSGRSEDEVLKEFAGKGFGVFKPALTTCVIEVIAPIRDEMIKWMREKPELDHILMRGGERARDIATPILREAKNHIGFIRRGRGQKIQIKEKLYRLEEWAQNNPDTWLGVNELSDIIKLSTSALRTMSRDGRLPPLQPIENTEKTGWLCSHIIAHVKG